MTVTSDDCAINGFNRVVGLAWHRASLFNSNGQKRGGVRGIKVAFMLQYIKM